MNYAEELEANMDVLEANLPERDRPKTPDPESHVTSEAKASSRGLPRLPFARSPLTVPGVVGAITPFEEEGRSRGDAAIANLQAQMIFADPMGAQQQRILAERAKAQVEKWDLSDTDESSSDDQQVIQEDIQKTEHAHQQIQQVMSPTTPQPVIPRAMKPQTLFEQQIPGVTPIRQTSPARRSVPVASDNMRIMGGLNSLTTRVPLLQESVSEIKLTVDKIKYDMTKISTTQTELVTKVDMIYDTVKIMDIKVNKALAKLDDTNVILAEVQKLSVSISALPTTLGSQTPKSSGAKVAASSYTGKPSSDRF